MGSHLIFSMLIVLIILLCAVTITQAAFTSTPTSVNATLGSTATFSCSPSDSAGAVFWMVNDSSLIQLNATDVTTSGPGDTSLHIPATEEYNNTDVRCTVVIIGESNQAEVFRSDPAVLRVQGLLAAVGNLQLKAYPEQASINLTWTPPFSLDITNMDPDLSYYVDVYNISAGGNLLIHSCNESRPEFTFKVPSPSPCDRFEFRVIPVNGAGNGSMASVNGTFFGKPEFGNATILVDVLSVTNMEIHVHFSHLRGVCNSRLLVATNQTSGTVLFPEHEGSSLSVNVINGTDGILFNYRYNITLELNNSAEESVISKNLSLFDVQKSVANNCSEPQTVNTSCIFAQNSQALGCVVVLHPWNSSQTEMFAYAAKNSNSDFASRDNVSIPIANISIHGVPVGNYTVVVFDGEESGLLSTQAATAMQHVTVTEGGSELPRMDSGASASIQESGNKICVSCSDMGNGEWKGCVVIVHSTQNLESAMSHEIPTSNEMCFPQEDGEYFVAVFRQNMNNVLQQAPVVVSLVSIHIPTPTPSISSSSPSTTPPTTLVDPVPVGAIVAVIPPIVLVMTAALVIVVIVAVIMKKRNCKTRDLRKDWESSIEELDLDSYQRAENGEIEPLRIAEDCGGETEIKPLCSMPLTDSSVEHCTVDHKHITSQQTSGPVYADVKALPRKTKPPAQDNNRVEYSAILHQSLVTSSCVEPTPPPLPAKRHKTNDPPSSQRSSLNLDNLFTELYPMNSKWQKLGEMLGMDEDLLDEIFTNNQRDEECLRVMLEMWVKNSMNPTWRTITDALEKIGEGKLAETLYLKCTLPGMVEPLSQRTCPEPAAARSMVYIPDEVIEMTSPEPPHYFQDQSLGESQASSDEKENISDDQKEEAHSDSESSTYADAVDGDTTHPSVEETGNKDGEYHGTLHSVRICSDDSGILLEEAKQEEGESAIPVSDESRKTKVELQSESEQLQPKPALYKDFRGCTEERSTCDEVKVTQESIKDLLTFQPITESRVTDENLSTLVIGCALPTPPGYDSQWTPVETDYLLVYTTPRVLRCNLRQLPELECTNPESGTGVASELDDAMLENTGKFILLIENTSSAAILSQPLKSWLKWSNQHKSPGVPRSSATIMFQLPKSRLKWSNQHKSPGIPRSSATIMSQLPKSWLKWSNKRKSPGVPRSSATIMFQLPKSRLKWSNQHKSPGVPRSSATTMSELLKLWLKCSNHCKSPGVPRSSATMLSQLLESWIKSWLKSCAKYVVEMAMHCILR